MTLSESASSYLASGLCVLPAIAEEKRPSVGRWKQYQNELPSENEVRAWFSNGIKAACLITGAVSGNLELIDFDCQGEMFEPWREKVEAESPGLLDRLYIETSPSGGRHAVYRCDQEICGSIKLTQRMDAVDPEEQTPDGSVMRFGKKYQARQDGDGNWQVLLTLIETRGEGGLFLCAPTPGYEPVQGDLSQLPVLSGAERDVLLQAAWALNEYEPPVVNGPANISHICGMSAENSHISGSPSHNGHGGAENSYNGGCASDIAHNADSPSHNGACASEISNRPGDDFNRRGDVRAVLAQCGWSRVKGGENEYWRRPGKTSGWSATLRDGVFYVFSSSAAPFEPNRGYSPFSVYALLLCGGDFEQAARSLRQSGYGGDSLPPSAPGVNISGILGQSGAQAAENSETVLTPRSLGDLLGEHPRLRKPVIHGLLREGETMNVIASPKVGKSWLVIDLALSVATGRPWFGMECEAGEVLIIDNELHGETSANRIPKVAQARGIRISEVADRIHVQNLRGHLQDLFALGPYFRQFEPGRFKIVILDAFYRFLPIRADENDNGTMANLYNCLDAFAGYLKCCFILIHHTSKGNQSQKGVTDVGAGAGAQSRATDTHLVLRRHEAPDAVVMDAAVRSWPPLDPRCLRWAFPVWTPADDLDPTVLQGSGSRGGSRRSDPEPEPEDMGVREFVETYLGPEPVSRAKLTHALKASGMKASHAKNLLEIALEDRLAFRWDIGNNLYGFATEPQPEDDLAVRKSPSKGDRVRRIIASNPSMDNQEVADECDVSPRYVRRIRAEIEEQGGTDR